MKISYIALYTREYIFSINFVFHFTFPHRNSISIYKTDIFCCMDIYIYMDGWMDRQVGTTKKIVIKAIEYIELRKITKLEFHCFTYVWF